MPEYVEIFLNASSTLLLLDELKTGISDSGVNLTQDKFRNIDFALPSLAEQKDIVRFVHELSKDSEIMENRWTRASAQIVSMGDALLVNAFSGSLLPQDTTDEPASVLLERIKSSAPASKQKKGPSAKRKAAKEP